MAGTARVRSGASTPLPDRAPGGCGLRHLTPYPERVFRSRSKDGQAPDANQASAAEPHMTHDPQAPKGRPTPKRSEAQQRRSLAKPTTNRKENAKRQREARRVDMAKQREALASGDERYLPARDKGKVRRFTRDFVDARWCVAEFFLPIAVIILVLSMLPSPQMQNISLVLWLFVIVVIIIDSIGLGIRLKRALAERFPDESRRGAIAYGLMRTLQLRKMRLPKPQIQRGERP